MLVFVVIMAMSLLFMMIRYSQNQRRIADNVREIIKQERGLQASLLCVGYISNTLARYSILNDDLIFNIKNLSINEGSDSNCKVISFENCNNACLYKATIEGNSKDEGNHPRVYVEWKSGEYRFYISKLRLI
jgi:hypothetical protein